MAVKTIDKKEKLTAAAFEKKFQNLLSEDESSEKKERVEFLKKFHKVE